ncbi:50S ribosomal protein L9 [Acidobacteriota bacterium]
MRVILRENIENLGKKGDIVKIASGYGRNFLIPKKMAIEITPTNAKMIAIEQAALQKGLEQEMSTYNELIQQLSQISLSFVRKASEKDVIFGSVSSTDIRDALEDLGFNIEKKKIILDEPIKRLGHFTVPVKVFHEERAEIKIEVVKEGAPTEEPKVEEAPEMKEEKETLPVASEEPVVVSTEEAVPEEEKEIEAKPKEIPIEAQEVELEAESQEKESEVNAVPEELPAESQETEQDEKTIDDAEQEKADSDLTEETIAEEVPVPEDEVKPPAPVDKETIDESSEETETQEEPSDKKKEEDKDKGV